jgi:hypothetical protein
MANSSSSTPQVRSTADFPKDVSKLSREDLEQAYYAMRTNHKSLALSQGRYKTLANQYKDKLLAESKHLGQVITTLKAEREALLRQSSQELRLKSQQTEALESELTEISARLEKLAVSFDGITTNGKMPFNERFGKLFAAIKELVLWWREPDSGESLGAIRPAPEPRMMLDSEQDDDFKKTDRASLGRNLLDR